MISYTPDEKNFLRMIVDKATATDRQFPKLVSENFFQKNFRPFMSVDNKNKRVILFFTKGKIHEEFFRFMNLVDLMKDLENDRLIIRLPLDQPDFYFVGELYDAEEKYENGKKRYVSESTGRYLEHEDLTRLYNREGGVVEKLDRMDFNGTEIFERLTKAFSGLVYPRETLRDLVENKFRSVDQRRHCQTMRAAWSAIILSLIFSVLSLIPRECWSSLNLFADVCDDRPDAVQAERGGNG